MKVVFFGTPHFVDPVVKVLQKNFEVVKIYHNPQEFDADQIDQLKSSKIDIFVVASFGKILPKEVLEIPKSGAINIHPSLLPQYRGPSPIQSVLLSGDTKTGVTFIKMDEEVDHGPIISQFEEEILPEDTFETLSKRLFALASEKLPEALTKLGQAKPQDESRATITKLLTRNSGLIDLQNSPDKDTLNRMIRAFYPWPGVWFKADLNGKQTIIKLLPKDQIQVEGKNPMSYKDFVNGYSEGKSLLTRLNLIK